MQQDTQTNQGVEPPIPDPKKMYRIAIASKPLQVMNVDLNPNEDTNVILWSSSGGANQKWTFEVNNDGEYTIFSLHQRLVLEISQLKGAKPDQVRVSVNKGIPRQKWRIARLNNGFSIRSVQNDTALRGFAPFDNSSRVAAQTFTNSPSETWVFVQA